MVEQVAKISKTTATKLKIIEPDIDIQEYRTEYAINVEEAQYHLQPTQYTIVDAISLPVPKKKRH